MNLPNINGRNIPWMTVLVVILVLTTYGLSLLLRKQSECSHELDRLQAIQRTNRALLDQKDLWDKRAKWIKQFAPTQDEEGKTKADVLEAALQGAREQHLRIIAQSLGELQRGPACLSVSANIKVQGTMESLCRWINAWQTPENFYTVTSLSIHPSEDHKTVICALTLKRFFQETK